MANNDIDVNVDVQFTVTIPDSTFTLGDFNRVELGIFDNRPLKNSKNVDAGIRTLAMVGRGLPTLYANHKDVGIYQQMSIAESFASVYEAHIHHRQKSYEEFLVDELYLTGDIIFHAWYLAVDGQHQKRSANAVRGVAVRAYAKMAWELRYLNSIERRYMKGFWLYAIGTGETLQSIQGRVTAKNA